MRFPRYAVPLLTAAALAVDAYVHAADAALYDHPAGGAITQGNLFRVEAGLAALAAVLLLVWPRLASWGLALLVAGSALGGVLLYRYVDVGSLGPIPQMYEPTWASPHKLTSAYAEGAAVVLAVVGLGLSWWAGQRPGRARS